MVVLECCRCDFRRHAMSTCRTRRVHRPGTYCGVVHLSEARDVWLLPFAATFLESSVHNCVLVMTSALQSKSSQTLTLATLHTRNHSTPHLQWPSCPVPALCFTPRQRESEFVFYRCSISVALLKPLLEVVPAGLVRSLWHLHRVTVGSRNAVQQRASLSITRLALTIPKKKCSVAADVSCARFSDAFVPPSAGSDRHPLCPPFCRETLQKRDGSFCQL